MSVGSEITISGPVGHHYARVLRATPGEPMAVASHGVAYLGTIKHADSTRGSVVISINEPLPSHESSVRVWLVQGLAKGDKIEEILEKCTEAGAAGFHVVATRRSVVQLDAKKVPFRLERWRNQVHEAASQSHRDMIPAVGYSSTLLAMENQLSRESLDGAFLLDEAQRETGLGLAVSQIVKRRAAMKPMTLALLVGPEGGWDDDERDWLIRVWNAAPVTLGPRILRTETAGLVALSALLYEFGDMGGR